MLRRAKRPAKAAKRASRRERRRGVLRARQAGGHWFEPSTAHRTPCKSGTFVCCPDDARDSVLTAGSLAPLDPAWLHVIRARWCLQLRRSWGSSRGCDIALRRPPAKQHMCVACTRSKTVFANFAPIPTLLALFARDGPSERRRFGGDRGARHSRCRTRGAVDRARAPWVGGG